MAATGPAVIRDVLLRDGTTLRLQTTIPGDFEDLRAFYGALSDESRYFRFHGYGRTDAVARAEAEATGIDRLALIARLEGRIVAIATYNGLREVGVAEVAFAVADDVQRRGIGTRMLEQLAAIAAERQIHRFDAEVMAANRPMLGVFQHAGFAIRRQGAFGEVTVSLDIDPSEAVLARIDERDHFAAVASLRSILAPRSIAVMGAENEPGNAGRAVLQNIMNAGFTGVVSPVNRAGGIVCSMPAARHLGELRAPPELVVIAAGGEALIELAAEAAEAGARALLVLPPAHRGDEEMTGELEARLLEIVRGSGLRMLGPNSLGVLNTAPAVALNATLAGVVSSGGLAVCSPSGAVGTALLGYAAARRLGISIFASLGDRCDVSTNDLLEFWEQDDRTVAAILYVETFGNPEHFARIAQRVSRKKPILAIKGRRRTPLAREREQSDTAAALRGDTVVDALLHQAGVLRARTGEELFNAAEFFARQPLPQGRQIGIVSNSRGVATLASDSCLNRGLELGRPAGSENPRVLESGAGPADYAAATGELLAEPGIDALTIHYIDRGDGDAAAVLAAVSSASAGQRKPVVASVLRADGQLPGPAPAASAHSGSPEPGFAEAVPAWPGGGAILAPSGPGVPNFLFPESCAAILARAAQRRDWLSRPLGDPPSYPDLDPAAARAVVESVLEREPGGAWLAPADAQPLLGSHGIVIGPGPVDPALAPGALGDVLVGAVFDAELGTVIAVGLGGHRAGLDRTTAFRLLPITDAEADELIDSSPAVASELDGYRGSPLLDRESLRELILRFALLLREAPEIVEADLNPVRCRRRGCTVLAARLRVQRRAPTERVKTW